MARAILLSVLALTLSASAASAQKLDKKCRERVKLLEKRLVEIPIHVGFGLPPMDVQLPDADRGTPITDRGIIIDMKGDQLGIEGTLSEEATLDEKLKRIDRVEKLIQRRGAPAYFRIDKRTKLEDALPVMCRVASERDVFLVIRNVKAKPELYSPPPPSKVAEEMVTDLMRRSDPKERAKLLSKAFAESVKGCSAIQSAVSAVYVAAPEDRTHFLKRAIVDGARACECAGIDIETLESLMILMAAPVSPPTYMFAPTIPCGQEKPYGLEMSARYGELVEKMASEARRPAGP